MGSESPKHSQSNLKPFMMSPNMQRILQKTEQDKCERRSVRDRSRVTFHGPGNFKSFKLNQSSNPGDIFFPLSEWSLVNSHADL